MFYLIIVLECNEYTNFKMTYDRYVVCKYIIIWLDWILI